MIIHVASFLIYSDIALRGKVIEKYEEFSARRFMNPWNVNVSETILLASCGDEFFRDNREFMEAAKHTNPTVNHSAIDHIDMAYEDDFNQSIAVISYPADVIGLVRQWTDTSATSNCIVFQACTLYDLPWIMKQVQFEYAYSSHPTDYHIMYYNNMFEISRPTYVWVIFGWVELDGGFANALGPEPRQADSWTRLLDWSR
jgi:hypothetical protein